MLQLVLQYHCNILIKSCHEVRKICKTLHLFCDARNMYVVPDASKLLLSRFDPSSWADSFDNPKSLVKSFSCAWLKGIGLVLLGIGAWYDADVSISSSSVSLSSVISMSFGTIGTGISDPWGTGFLADGGLWQHGACSCYLHL